jgi:hypothetical protein
LRGRTTALQFNIAADRLVNAEQTYLKPSIIGSFNNNTWTVAATTKDGDNKDFYGVKGAILVEDEKNDYKINRRSNTECRCVGRLQTTIQ